MEMNTVFASLPVRQVTFNVLDFVHESMKIIYATAHVRKDALLAVLVQFTNVQSSHRFWF